MECKMTEIKEDSEEIKAIEQEKRGTKRPQGDDNLTRLPKELKDMFKPLKCELCDVTVTSPVVAYTHYEGKSHLKNVNAYMRKHYNVEAALKKKKLEFEPLKCEVCDLELSSEIVYQQHIAGKQHQKNIKRKKIIPPITKIEIDTTGRFGIGKSFYKEIDQSTQPLTVESQLFCDLCNVFTNTEQQMAIHKQGQKHIKNIAKLKNRKEKETIVNTTKEYYNEQDVWEANPDEKPNSE